MAVHELHGCVRAEYGRGGTCEKDWVSNSAQHGNAVLYARLSGGGSRTKSASNASTGVAPVPPSAAHASASTSAHSRSSGSYAGGEKSSGSAEHDFDGHRVEAIKHFDMAIHEAEICESMK